MEVGLYNGTKPYYKNQNNLLFLTDSEADPIGSAAGTKPSGIAFAP